MNEDIQQREFQERFGVAIENWRFQVSAQWNRATYFSLFQIAAFSSTWNVVTTGRHRYSAVFLTFAACAISIIWFVNSLRMHEYANYWWHRAAAIEKDFNITPARSLIQSTRDHKGIGARIGHHSAWMKAIPLVFLSAWLWMLCWSLAEVAHYLHSGHF